jgi:hypothetical protein
MKREVRRIHWYTAEKEKTDDSKVIKDQWRTAFFIISWIILRDLSTIQFRLAFKDKGHNFHKSLEYCCLVIHLTSVSKNFLRWIERWYFYPYCAIRHYKYKDKRTACDLSVCQQIYVLRAILSTIQFRLIFKGHQSQKYCCLFLTLNRTIVFLSLNCWHYAITH